MTFEFEIFHLMEGSYQGDSIAISILCPREAAEKWLATGKLYVFHLIELKGTSLNGFEMDADKMKNYMTVYEVVEEVSE